MKSEPILRLVPTPPKPQYYGMNAVSIGDYVIGVERLSDMLPEIQALHEAHWKETEELYLDDPLDPDYQTMLAMESDARWVTFTVRDSTGEMVGNAMFALGLSVHMKGVLQAKEDTFYITKPNRGTSLADAFLSYIECFLKELGVVYMGMSDKSPTGGKSLHKLMSRHGFKSIAMFYNKKLV